MDGQGWRGGASGECGSGGWEEGNGLVAEASDALREVGYSIEDIVEGTGEVECGDFESLAGVSDLVDDGLLLSLRVDEHSAGHVECGDVGEKRLSRLEKAFGPSCKQGQDS